MPVEKLEAAQASATSAGTLDGAPAALGAPPNGGNAAYRPWRPGDGSPPGFALTRTGRPVVETLPEPGTLHCPACGSTMELKRGRFGPFFSCRSFPQCKFNANLRGEAKKEAELSLPAPARPKPIATDILCDECSQPMVIRTGRRGRFLGCSGYPKCKGTKELPRDFRAKPEAVAAHD
jgi:ssDNA-binding Zn-finger/Zn-ribbon topoisomerase 1